MIQLMRLLVWCVLETVLVYGYGYINYFIRFKVLTRIQKVFPFITVFFSFGSEEWPMLPHNAHLFQIRDTVFNMTHNKRIQLVKQFAIQRFYDHMYFLRSFFLRLENK